MGELPSQVDEKTANQEKSEGQETPLSDDEKLLQKYEEQLKNDPDSPFLKRQVKNIKSHIKHGIRI